jgi:hypothetical protein
MAAVQAPRLMQRMCLFLGARLHVVTHWFLLTRQQQHQQLWLCK